MEPLDTLHALQAASSGYAVRRTTRRHVHLVEQPFVIVGYHLAGDPGAPLAIMYGTDSNPDNAHMVVVPEPRNRGLRFESLETFGRALNGYLDSSPPGGPQLLFPNAASAEWMLGLVARFTRYLPKAGDNAVPADIPDAGSNMTALHQLMVKPGSNIVLKATEALTEHYRTGQLASENFNLAALMGWVDPAPGMTGAEAARIGERKPPAGPLSDPFWDAEYLEPFIGRWRNSNRSPAADRIHAILRAELEGKAREALAPAWMDTWRARELLLAMEPTADSADRYAAELNRWEAHQMNMATGNVRFTITPRPVPYARLLADHEMAAASYEASSALSDPLVMARSAAKGLVLDGEVLSVEPTARVSGKLRPLLEVMPAVPCDLPLGQKLYLASHPSVVLVIEGEVRARSTDPVRLRVVAGANSARTSYLLPQQGTHLIASGFREPTNYRREWGEEPWTHRMPQ